MTGSYRTSHLGRVALVAVGMLLGGAVTASVATILHWALQLDGATTLILPMGLVTLAVSSWDLRSVGVLKHPHRQTKVAFRRFLSLSACCLVWGFDIGLGVTTFRVSRLFWVLLIVASLVRPPGAFVMLLIYEMSLLAVMLWRGRRLTPQRLVADTQSLDRSQRLVGFGGLGVAISLLIVVIA